MYFLEFLETCTIGWVSFCEGGVGVGNANPQKLPFSLASEIERLTAPPPALPVHPAGGDPSPSAPGQPAQHRKQGKPRHAPAHTPKRWARCTGLHSIPDRTRGVIGTAAGRWKAWSVSETVQKRTSQNLKNKYAKKRKYLLTFTQESV